MLKRARIQGQNKTIKMKKCEDSNLKNSSMKKYKQWLNI